MSMQNNNFVQRNRQNADFAPHNKQKQKPRHDHHAQMKKRQDKIYERWKQMEEKTNLILQSIYFTYLTFGKLL